MKKNFTTSLVRQDTENDGWQDVKVLSREEVRAITQQQPKFSFAAVVVWQMVFSLSLVLFMGWRASSLSDPAVVAAAYGSACIWLPQLLQNWGMRRHRLALEAGVLVNHAGLALVHVYTWEMVKVGLTLVMLALAPVLMSPVRWLPLVLGFVLCLKLGWWMALMLHVRRSRRFRSTSQVVN